MPHHCCAFDCSNNSSKPECKQISFYKFPLQNDSLNRAWLAALERDNFKATIWTKICSEHFTPDSFECKVHWNDKRRILKKDAVPSLFKFKQTKPSRIGTTYTFGATLNSSVDGKVVDDPMECQSSCCQSTQTNIGFGTLIDELHLKTEELEKLKDSQNAFFNPNKMSDAEIRTFTGFDKEAFFKIFTFLNFKEGKSECLTPLQEFFLFMFKLRTGVTVDHLAYVFKVSPATISRTFNKMTEIIYLKIKQVDIWPDKEQVEEFMPYTFKIKYPKCRVIIDCTEIFIQKPTNPKEQQLTFSNYKNCNTMKALVGIAPSGGISFISDLWCGSVSDKVLYLKSELPNLLEPGDVVLADKGFKIEKELESIGCLLSTPLYLKDKIQFTLEERGFNKEVSHLRVHVERAISRIKTFKYFEGYIPYNSLHNLNEVFTIASFLTNFHKPLISSTPID